MDKQGRTINEKLLEIDIHKDINIQNKNISGDILTNFKF